MGTLINQTREYTRLHKSHNSDRGGMNMREYRLAVLPGDGIGPEVITESVKTLTALGDIHGGFCFDIQQFDWSTECYLRERALMAADGLAVLERGNFDSIRIGPI